MEILFQVIPGSKKISVEENGKDILTGKQIYKVKLTAKPVNGQANEQLQEVLADYFNVKKRFVQVQKGATSRLKLVKIVKD